MSNIPQIDKTPEQCPICDATLALGLLTSVCEGEKDPRKKGKCFDLLKPLETGKKKAAESMADIIVELGDDNINSVVDRFNLLMYDATSRAKTILIQKGVLNSDGSPKG